MSESNTSKRLSFSEVHLDAQLLNHVDNLPVNDRMIAVNISKEPVSFTGLYDGDTADGNTRDSYISPWKSTILQGVVIRSGNALVVLGLRRPTNIGGLILNAGWQQFTSIEPTFPRGTPMWRSSEEVLGNVSIDPRFFTRQSSRPVSEELFQIKVKLWFATAQTDCVIHTGHKFLEVHTQIYGTGRMQKFTDQSEASMYEDVIMEPGFTHDPFPIVDDAGKLKYPWHRYFADTDCIWMATELRRVSLDDS